MDTKKVDTIEMIRTIRDKHARHLAGMSHAERIVYYRERAKKMEKKVVVLLSKLAIAESRGEYIAISKHARTKRRTHKEPD